MKSAILLLLAAASVTAGELQVRLSARTESTSRDTDALWKTDYGSYDRNVFQMRNISAAVECTKGEGKATLLVQWIGRDKGDNSKAVIYSRSEQPLDLKKGLKTTSTAHEVFAESDAKYKALGERDRSGHRFGGWIVRVLDEKGNVLAEQSSSTPLLKKFPASAEPEKAAKKD